ncbi:MAG TPA: translesion DNA synthesis-associated protein ImuA [Gammaproteobacteria bacterium]
MSIEKLVNHPHIWQGAANHSLDRVHPTGFEALDDHLPGGGWPAATLTEIVLEDYGIGELSLLMPALARLNRSDPEGGASGWILWVAPPFIPYAPALSKHGVDLTRLLFVHTAPNHHDSLWAVEQALRAGSCAAVLAWVQSADETALRRLQLAAEEGNCWAVLFRPEEALHQRSPAALRLRLLREDDVTRVEILKCRGGRPATIRLCHRDRGDTG